MAAKHSNITAEALAVINKHGFKLNEDVSDTWVLEVGKLRHILSKLSNIEKYSLHGNHLTTWKEIYAMPFLEMTAEELDVFISTTLRTTKTWTAFH